MTTFIYPFPDPGDGLLRVPPEAWASIAQWYRKIADQIEADGTDSVAYSKELTGRGGLAIHVHTL